MLNQSNYKNSSYFLRRSIRSFVNKEVEEWKEKALIEAFFQTQTAKNQMGWEIIVVKDKDLIQNMRKAHYFGRALETAPLCFVVTSVQIIRSIKSSK